MALEKSSYKPTNRSKQVYADPRLIAFSKVAWGLMDHVVLASATIKKPATDHSARPKWRLLGRQVTTAATMQRKGRPPRTTSVALTEDTAWLAFSVAE
jgi:hypothetical protein